MKTMIRLMTCAVVATMSMEAARATLNIPSDGSDAAILIMEEMGTPGEGTRPTGWRFCGGCRPGALTRRGATGL